MINTFDYSAVNSYMNEQTKRESEKTRSKALKNDRSHAINQGIKWSFIALGLGIGLFIALSGVGNALSFKQIKENINSTFSETFHNEVPTKVSSESEDVLLDVEALLEDVESFPKIEEQKSVDSVTIKSIASCSSIIFSV